MRLHLGWLSPSAELIECDYMSHSGTAAEIINNLGLKHDYSIADDDFLFKNGYVKIGFSMLGKQEYYILWETTLTDMQIAYLQQIFDNENGFDFPISGLSKMDWDAR